jgi:polyadenylate-binding protein
VRNLPKDLDQKQLMELFQEFGKIGSCKLEVFADGKSRGFGYVQFLEQASAESAIEKLNDKKLGENVISVAVHSKKDEREAQSEKYTNLFVRNLPQSYNESQLKNLFSEYGEINSITMDTSKKG